MNLKSIRRPVRLLLLALGLVLAAPSLEASEACGRLAAAQNDVRTRGADSESWEPATKNQELQALDRVRTGAASRAAILYSDQTLHRINEKSEVEVRAPDSGNPGVLRVIAGKHYFSSRQPKDYGRIETPTVTAAIRGTEFAVDVDADGTTTITMLEGVVDASNEFGSLRVSAGEAAHVEPGKAPVRQIVVRPRDAVTWSLYYPRVLGKSDVARLDAMGQAGQDLKRAADLLYAGQVSEATPLIEGVRRQSPNDPVALALASVIDIVADRKEDGMDKALRAYKADSKSSAAALGLSYAYQAGFDIAQARKLAETAARNDLDSAEALARVAELRLAEGDIRGARDAAEAAVRRDANSVRAMAVLGFVKLAQLRSKAALEIFREAVEIDSGFPLARLGYGIALLRQDLSAGREEIQNAVILDPDNSLLRSYLAKAYYEERRENAATKELAAAKELDPSDPTPYLYDAILKQTYNRPVEALEDLQQSVRLNDNRAVYRSRLLLDEDLAVRSADLASIYNDLGFEQLGLVTARQSADLDQSNYSSHLFLAGTYRNLPGFASAFLSETLQSRIYQPVSVNAVRPDVVNESVSFNEYTALFDRPRLRGFVGASYGQIDSDIYPEGAMCPDPVTVFPFVDCKSLENSNSRIRGGDVTLTFNRDRFAGAIAYRQVKDDGFRPNSDAETSDLRGFLVYAPTPRDQFQLNVIDGNRESGDLPLRTFPANYGIERTTTDLTNVGLGYHRIISPAADLAISAIYNDATQLVDLADPFVPVRGEGDFKGGQLEAQYVLRQSHVVWTAGAGHFDGEQTVSSQSLGPSGPVESEAKGDDKFSNAYVYAKFPDLGVLTLTTGLSWEDVTAPLGLLPPRDALFGISELPLEDSQVSGKLGLSIQAARKTVLRASAYQRLTPAIGRLQTLEPTQVAGFNQFYNDTAGTSSVNFGFGLDQQFGGGFFAGLSVLRRNLDIPEPFCTTPNQFVGCQGQTVDTVARRTSDDWLGDVYFNGTLGKRVAISLEYAYEERDFDFTQKSNNSLFDDYLETHRLRPQLRFFLPMGLYFSVRGTRFDQRIDQYEFYADQLTPARSVLEQEFWIGDLELGYRLPKRYGSVALRVFNFSDREFDFFLSSLEQDVIPARRVLLNLTFTSR